MGSRRCQPQRRNSDAASEYFARVWGLPVVGLASAASAVSRSFLRTANFSIHHLSSVSPESPQNGREISQKSRTKKKDRNQMAIQITEAKRLHRMQASKWKRKRGKQNRLNRLGKEDKVNYSGPSHTRVCIFSPLGPAFPDSILKCMIWQFLQDGPAPSTRKVIRHPGFRAARVMHTTARARERPPTRQRHVFMIIPHKEGFYGNFRVFFGGGRFYDNYGPPDLDFMVILL